MRIAESEIEPTLLRSAHHRAARRAEARASGDVQRVRAALAAGTRARMPRAVLAIVDEEEARERAPAELRIDAHVRPLGPHACGKRHVLVVRAVRRRAPLEERLAPHSRPRTGGRVV